MDMEYRAFLFERLVYARKTGSDSIFLNRKLICRIDPDFSAVSDLELCELPGAFESLRLPDNPRLPLTNVIGRRIGPQLFWIWQHGDQQCGFM
jgi:hypothetical protein